MRAVRLERHGGNDRLALADVARPAPKDKQLLVRVHAASINPIDWKVCQGYFPLLPGQRMPMIPGSDFSGVVEAAGSAVQGFSPGDEVFGLLGGGVGHTFAEYVAAPEKLVVAKPAALSHAQAAALPLAGVTALTGLKRVIGLKSGQRLFVNGGSGGVGSIAVQYARHLGAEVIASCSSDNAQWVRELGAAQVVDYRSRNPAEVLEGLDAVFDTIGNLHADDYFGCLKRGGVFATTGTGGRSMEQLVERHGKRLWLMAGLADVMKLNLRGRLRHGVKVGMVLAQPRRAYLEELAALAEQGVIQPRIDRSFTLEQVPEAFAASQTGRTRGKLIVDIGA